MISLYKVTMGKVLFVTGKSEQLRVEWSPGTWYV